MSRYGPPPPPGDPRHGSASTYKNYRCRCDACTAAHRDAWREASRRRGVRPFAEYAAEKKAKAAANHGRGGIRRGCRCPICTEASRVARADRRSRARERVAA